MRPDSLRGALAGALCAAAAAAQLPNPFKVVVSEVSWGDLDGVEIVNHGAASADLTNHVVKWNDGAVAVSAPLGVVLGPGEFLLVTEPGPAPAEAPAYVPRVVALPPLATAAQGFAVALVDGAGAVVDEVLVGPIGPGFTPAPFGEGSFLGTLARAATVSPFGAVGAERFAGLDGNVASDWTIQSNRSFGLPNRSSGVRGVDLAPPLPVRINEIVAEPTGYVEIALEGGAAVDLHDCYLLAQGDDSAPTLIRPWPSATLLTSPALLRHAVVGDGPAPAGVNPSAPYADLTALGYDLPFAGGRATVALYDPQGRLLDMVRVAAPNTDFVVNGRRVPAAATDFRGAVRRAPGQVVARRDGSDSDTANDWGVAAASGLGYVGPQPTLASAFLFDVEARFEEFGAGGVLLALRGIPAWSGDRYSLMFSFQRTQGTGPFLGLGTDALQNWLAAFQVPPLSGPLDADASAYYFAPPGTLPSGFGLDARVVVDDGQFFYLRDLGPVVAFDT